MLFITGPAFGQSRAEDLILAGHWKQARSIVQAHLSQSPGDPLSNYLLSQISHAFGDDVSPRPLAEKAVALDGTVAKYHRQLAEVVGIEAQHASPFRLVFLAHQFRGELDTAISLDPRDIQAQRDLLEYYLVAPGIAGGDVKKAAAVAQHIAEMDPAEGFLAKARVAAFRRHDAETAALLVESAGVLPPSYKARAELAKFYLAPGHSNPAGAENAAKEMLKLDRTRVEPWSALAEIYAEREDWSDLEATLTAASQQVPDDLAPYYQAAAALLRTGHDPARAERYLRVYLEHEPEGNEPTLADARRKLTQKR
ncbi:MAG TPA: hypothetical protein VHC90_10095 [Bryobacteraceae bacterium]|nr:hypothetical protein [Bryobacteraceae bacterium]